MTITIIFAITPDNIAVISAGPQRAIDEQGVDLYTSGRRRARIPADRRVFPAILVCPEYAITAGLPARQSGELPGNRRYQIALISVNIGTDGTGSGFGSCGDWSAGAVQQDVMRYVMSGGPNVRDSSVRLDRIGTFW
ncbi:hypothetical protein ACWEQG_21310 [Microbispora sp. NPDC004025]